MDETKAEELKNQGNEEFKAGRYLQAIDFYSQAIGNNIHLIYKIINIEISKNEGILTNRAASYMQLKKYTLKDILN